jgi:tetratricopeptide (TPR) repeat protein
VPLNWIYAPANHSDRVDYVLFYPTNRMDSSLPELKKGIPIQYDYLAGHFDGNTSQALAFYYDPPACLRLLEPDIDPNNRFILDESLMREASSLSNPEQIENSSSAVMPPIYYPEPVHGWCYYFEKADLARQFGDWEEVVKLGDTAFKLDDHPNNPVERFVFIEAYAHVGDWERALKLSRESYKISKDYVGPLLCLLWKRIDTETTDGAEKSATLSEVKTMFACKP